MKDKIKELEARLEKLESKHNVVRDLHLSSCANFENRIEIDEKYIEVCERGLDVNYLF